MKALTVQNPYAWAIIRGGKSIENRTQLFAYRGPLLIHAGTKWPLDGAANPLIQAAWTKTPDNPAVPADRLSPWHFPSGAIIGVVDLVDVHHDAGCCTPWGEHGYTRRVGGPGRHITHLVLENPRPIAPIKCRGQLGIWTPPAYVLDRIGTEISEQEASA